ncbi:MAG TPA: hypothetical protein VJ937_15015 [Salinivirga sp.]|uniref:hypothetical protein n=1 Tax=Salinivirga sp. TaxID=1970192 RepID=UPI002B46EBD8|nr:hypothetical protein [Salinivirga sp.]HKK60790.1 hypothetical protein [Salinivirga sp.]
MKYLLYILLLLFLLLSSCAPTEDMHAGKIGANNEMPRFCHQPRLLFYEVLTNDEWVRLWLHTANSITVGQLLKNPLRIYFAEKNKRNVKFILEYSNVFDDKSPKAQNDKPGQRQLTLYEIGEKDTIDITSQYNFNVNADLDDQKYDLKIQWPRELLEGFEEIAIGIESHTNLNPGQANRVNLRGTTEMNDPGQQKRATAMRQNPSSTQRTAAAPNGYKVLDLDIDIWFTLHLSLPGAL